MASISITVAPRTATANITAAGVLDWLVPLTSGPDTYTRKSGGGSLISAPSYYGPDAHAYNSVIGDQTLSWTDGDSPASATSDRGMYNYGNISFTVPASKAARRVRVYAGVGPGETLTCTATLSDGSASAVAASWATTGDCLFDVNYAAASAGQSLTIALTRAGTTNYIYLNGVALARGAEVLFADGFNRADGGVGANYTDLLAQPMQVASNRLKNTGGGGAPSTVYWNGGTIADGYIQAVVAVLPTGTESAYLGLRYATATGNGYALYLSSSAAAIQRLDAGVGTTLGATFALPSAGQTVRLSMEGAVIRVAYDGVEQAARVDTTYSAAARAMVSFSSATAGEMDDLEIGLLRNFGITAPGAGSSPTQDGRYWASKFTLSEDAELSTVTAFFDFDAGNTSNSGDSAKAVIYADSAGSPGALKAVSSAVSVPAGDVAVTFPTAATLPARTYWIGIVNNGSQSRLNSTSSGGEYVRKETLTYASPADPMGTPDAQATGSGNFTVFATYTPADSPIALEQARYRFRNDDGSETTATWAAAEDTPISLAKNTPVRLRVEIGATDDPASAAYKLQYRKVGDEIWRDVN